MAQTNAEHVASVKAYEAKLRGQDLPENVTKATPAYVDALDQVADPDNAATLRRSAGLHLCHMVDAGAAGFIPMPDDLTRNLAPAAREMVDSDSMMVKGMGVRLATAMHAHNLTVAEKLDHATRLDEGTATEHVTLGPMKMPGARGVTPPETKGGGDPDIGTLPAQPSISQKQVSAPRPDPST